MKRLVLIVAILAMTLSGCSFFNEESFIEKVTPESLSSKINDKETFILVLGNERNCEPCVEYKEKTLERSYKETSEKVSYLEIDTVNEQKSMDSLISTLAKDLKIDVTKAIATPSTYFISKGKVVQRSTGSIDYEKFISYQESLNSIK